MEERKQLHVSGIEMNARCGEAFRRRHIEGEIRPPNAAMLAGTGTDRAVTRNLQNKLETGVLLDEEQVKDAARDAVNVEWDKGVQLSGEDKAIGEKRARGETVDKAIRLAVAHHQSIAPNLNPIHVQRLWTIDIDGTDVSLAGAIDVQEAGVVRDTKTAAKSPVATAADDSDQLTMYSLATSVLDGSPCSEVALDFVVDLKRSSKTMTLTSTRDEADYRALLNRVSATIDAINKGVFLPASRRDWWCSKQWCGYYDSCPYVRSKLTVGV